MDDSCAEEHGHGAQTRDGQTHGGWADGPDRDRWSFSSPSSTMSSHPWQGSSVVPATAQAARERHEAVAPMAVPRPGPEPQQRTVREMFEAEWQQPAPAMPAPAWQPHDQAPPQPGWRPPADPGRTAAGQIRFAKPIGKTQSARGRSGVGQAGTGQTMGKLVAVLALVPIAVSSVLGLMGKDGSVEGTQPPAQVQVDGGAGDVTLQVSTGVGRYELPDRWSAMPGDAVDRFQNELTPGAWLTVQRTPSTSEPLESQCLSQAPVMDGRQPVPLPAPPGIAGAPAVALEGTGEAGSSLTWCLEHDRDVVVLVGGSASADRVVVEEAMTRVADSFQ